MGKECLSFLNADACPSFVGKTEGVIPMPFLDVCWACGHLLREVLRLLFAFDVTMTPLQADFVGLGDKFCSWLWACLKALDLSFSLASLTRCSGCKCEAGLLGAFQCLSAGSVISTGRLKGPEMAMLLDGASLESLFTSVWLQLVICIVFGTSDVISLTLMWLIWKPLDVAIVWKHSTWTSMLPLYLTPVINFGALTLFR